MIIPVVLLFYATELFAFTGMAHCLLLSLKKTGPVELLKNCLITVQSKIDMNLSGAF